MMNSEVLVGCGESFIRVCVCSKMHNNVFACGVGRCALLVVILSTYYKCAFLSMEGVCPSEWSSMPGPVHGIGH